MKIGVLAGFTAETSPEHVAAVGRIAEARDFHSLWVPEHVLLFHDYRSRYPYSPDGKMPSVGGGLIDPFTALTFLAATTERIRLGTGICIVPQRNPVYTAKHVADLDHLSGGRVDFGVGIGWLREEFEALGVPWARRGARTDDALELMKALWSGGSTERTSAFHPFPDCVFGPKPVQSPHPPIHVGGNSDAALRRVARLGQGWYGHDLSPDDARGRLAALDAALAREVRKRGSVFRTVSPLFRPVDGDRALAYRDLGVDQLLLPLLAEDVDGLERRADEILRITEKVR